MSRGVARAMCEVNSRVRGSDLVARYWCTMCEVNSRRVRGTQTW